MKRFVLPLLLMLLIDMVLFVNFDPNPENAASV